MADLELTLSWLDMSQYFQSLVQAGFDSWETVLEITEEDLESLGVELGHRRKLQREIANTRRLAQDPAFVSPLYQAKPSQGRRRSVSQSGVTKKDSQLSASGKRGYRHHPKPDENAPQRPYSAYVMFSNWVREEMKDEPLSFADISRQVGEKWQTLSPEEKEGWKQKAAVPWEKYKQDLVEYQKTENYRKYNQYVNDFNTAQASKKGTAKGVGRNGVSSAFLYSGKPGQAHLQQSPEKVLHRLPLGQELSPPSEAFRGTSTLTRAPDSDSRDSKRQDTGVPIPRINWNAASSSTASNSAVPRVPRVNQACEPCRQRKSKCDGERPMCKHCHALNVECYYQDGKKDKGKKLTEQLWKKLSAYEDLLLQIAPELDSTQKSAAQRALLLPPQLKNPEEAVSRISRKETANSHGSDSGGESVASGVGSMGSTDHVNENDFNNPAPESQDRTFAGQASDTTWMQKLTTELIKKPDKAANSSAPKPTAPSFLINNRDTASSSNELSPSLEDIGPSAIGNQIDPYEMPVKSTADALIEIYFDTVHPSFPILDEDAFLSEYAQYFANSDPQASRYQTFIPMLQITFAIAAVHAHMIEAQWVGDDRDHLLYFARARVLSGETGFLYETIHLGQVQIFGLASMYLLATHQVNRAWNILGLAIRSAQGLGMHLENTTPRMSDSDKLHRIRIWFSLLTTERILSVVTGRPCMVKEQDCSIPIPLPPPITDEERSKDVSLISQAYSSLELRRHSRSPDASRPSLSSLESRAKGSSSPVAMTYFFYYIELHSLSQRILEELYPPDVRHLKWAEIQRRIIKLDGQLLQWMSTLPTFLDPQTPSRDPRTESFRVTLAILSHSMRAIINRPCLCRISHRIAHQSDESLKDTRETANRCVSSAQTVLTYLPSKPDPHSLRRSPVWWMLLHHIRRAATVLLLELSYRAEHMPSEAEEILVDAKKAINWLRSMASSSLAAHRSWTTLSNLLRIAAKRIGGSTEDIVTALPEEQSIQRTSKSRAQQTSAHHMPSYASSFDPNKWEPMDFFEFGGLPIAGDVQVGGVDRFAFYQQNGQHNLFPSASEIGQLAMEQDQQQEDQGMLQAADTEMWFGFDPGN